MKPVLGIKTQEEIKSFRELDAFEYTQYKNAVDWLGTFMTKQDLILIVFRNYDEYKNLLGQFIYIVQNSSAYLPTTRSLQLLSLDIKRCVLNFLSSVRTFLDHHETHLKRHYGKKSPKFKRFKEACSNAYDNNFSYRFIYELRNYTQHCGMPLSNIQFDTQLLDSRTKDLNLSVSLFCDRDELLENHNWKRVTEDLKNQPTKIEINSHIARMVECLKDINLVITEDDLLKIIENASVVESLIAPLRREIVNSKGSPIIFHRVRKGDTKLELEIELVPAEWIDLIKVSYPKQSGGF